MVAAVPAALTAVLAARLWCSGLPQITVEHDMAILELFTRNVFHGGQLLGAYSRFGFHHPGPLLFYLFAPAYELGGQSFSALLATAVTVNAACVGTISTLVWRTGERPLALWLTVCLSLYLLYLEPDVLCSAWNPHLAILPYALTVVAFGCWLAGQRWALPIGAVAGSIAVQAHVSFVVPMAFVLVGAMVIVLGRASMKRPPMGGVSWTGLRAPVAAASGLAGMLWLPVVLEQLLHSPGNLTRLLEFAASAPSDHTFGEALAAVTSWSGAFVLAPAGWASRTPLSDHAVVATHAVTALLMVLLAALFCDRSARTQIHRMLGGVALLSLVGAIVVTSRINGPMSDYLVRWTSLHGPLLGTVVLGWLHTRFLDGRPGARASRRIALIVPLLVIALASAGLLGKTIRFESLGNVSQRPQYQRLEQLVRKVDARLAELDAASPRFHSGDPDCLYDLGGIALQLVKRGYRVSSAPQLEFFLGPAMARPDADSVVVLAAPAVVQELATGAGREPLDTGGPCAVLVARELLPIGATVVFGRASDQLFISSGFYGRERGRGGTFRWSQGDRSSLLIPMAKTQDARVEIDAAPFPLAGHTQQLQLHVNGHALATLEMTPGRATYRWRLPAALVQEQTQLELTFAYTASPHTLGRSDDRRRLAVQFFTLRTIPADRLSVAR